MQYLPDAEAVRSITTGELRERFLVTGLFRQDAVTLRLVDLDRVVLGGVVPVSAPLRLEAIPELAAQYFAERREIGLLNTGGAGRVTVDGTVHAMAPRDGLYIGRGSREVVFESDSSNNPARFYLVSYPAHASHPTRHIAYADIDAIELGSEANANRRRLCKYIHPDGVQSAQLVMGITELQDGSVWNTMPPHTHQRRTEVYLYFDLQDAIVFHLMGEPEHTRHLVVRDGEAALSPGWSVHAGCGTARYTFCWAMGGENQDFTDMQAVQLSGIL